MRHRGCQRRHDRLEADAGLCSVTAGGQLRADASLVRDVLAAAAAWEALAAELRTTASTYDALMLAWPTGHGGGPPRGIHGGCRHAPVAWLRRLLPDGEQAAISGGSGEMYVAAFLRPCGDRWPAGRC